MLRASIETDGAEADYRGLVDGESAESSSVPFAGPLVGLVDASLSGDEQDGLAARARVRHEMGWPALVDAAAVIGNFERMTRIADGTGIPLDAPVKIATESIRADMGIDQYRSAANTRPVAGWQRLLGRVIEPAARAALRIAGRRARSRSETSSDA
jgi:hypothetical protein